MLQGLGRRRSRGEGGAAAVEFALVAPLLIFLLFAIIGYGYMLSFRQSISQAAAEGARAAAVAPSALTDAQVADRARTAINNSLSNYGVKCQAAVSADPATAGTLMRGSQTAGTCTISPPQSCTTSTVGAQCVKVTLSFTYRDDALVPVPGLGIVLPESLTYSSETQVS